MSKSEELSDEKLNQLRATGRGRTMSDPAVEKGRWVGVTIEDGQER